MYYDISESAARAAKEASSFSDYIPGSATAEYRGMVDDAAALAQRCTERHPDEADKIARLLDSYARRLADNINATNANWARCPSVMIAGPSNFPVRKKERQVARDDTLRAEYREISGLLDKMRSVGTGGIQSGDPHALDKLQDKLTKLEGVQRKMREANAEARRSGHPVKISDPDVMQAALRTSTPFPAWALSNNNAEIHRLRDRVAALEKAKQAQPKEDVRAGYTYREDTDAMRVQLIFDGKPDEATRSLLKSHGFRWAPSAGAWQRQLTANGRYAAKEVMQQL